MSAVASLACVLSCSAASKSQNAEVTPAAAPVIRETDQRSEQSQVASVAPEASSLEPDEYVPPQGLMRAISPTQFAEDLRRAGVDPEHMVSLSELSAKVKLDVMEVMAKAMGVKCNYCHVSDTDLRTDTPHKQVARRMWNEFVVPHRLADGPLFCDSCHHESSKILDREHRAAVKAYMKSEFSGKLVRHDGSRAACKACHGEPFEPHIIRSTWRVAEP